MCSSDLNHSPTFGAPGRGLRHSFTFSHHHGDHSQGQQAQRRQGQRRDASDSRGPQRPIPREGRGLLSPSRRDEALVPPAPPQPSLRGEPSGSLARRPRPTRAAALQMVWELLAHPPAPPQPSLRGEPSEPPSHPTRPARSAALQMIRELLGHPPAPEGHAAWIARI